MKISSNGFQIYKDNANERLELFLHALRMQHHQEMLLQCVNRYSKENGLKTVHHRVCFESERCQSPVNWFQYIISYLNKDIVMTGAFLWYSHV